MGLFSRTLSRLDELKRVLTKDPASRQFLALADEHRRQGETAEAISVLEKGLAQNPTAVAGHVALGRLFQQAGRGEDAIASFLAALRLDPQNLVALRQAADLYLAKGDKVEAIKKLKLYRGLSPGDREVNGIIRQLDEELAATAAPRPPAGAATGVVPPLPAEAAAYPPRAPVLAFGAGENPFAPEPAPAAAPEVPAIPAPPAAPTEIPSAGEPSVPLPSVEEPAVFPEAPDAAAAPALPEAGGGPFEEAVAAEPASEEPPAPEAEVFAPPGVLPAEAPAVAPEALAQAVPLVPAPADVVPEATETLAALLRAQGHLAEAEESYRALAAREPDPARARRLAATADELARARLATPRGRLEAWVAPFERVAGPRDSDLVAAVETAVRRLGHGSALVTDIEGVPVVSVGPRDDAEAMESLAAELTAFWKNVRRSRAELGEGALDGLVLSCSAGKAIVKVITPSYALLVRTGAGIPAGRLRYEAARAAEQLRPALL